MPHTPSLPETPGRPLLGHLPDIMRHGTFSVFREHWLTHGEAFAVSVGRRKLLTFVHPDAVEQVLLTQRDGFVKGSGYDQIRLLVGDGVLTVEGERWRQQRRTIQPCMNRAFLVGFADTMVKAAADMAEGWAARGPSLSFDIYPEMLSLALRILGETLFDLDLSRSADTSTRAFTVALEAISHRGNTLFAPPLSWPTPGNLRLRRALRELAGIVDGMVDARIAARERGESTPADMLTLLLDHRDEDGAPMDRRLMHDEIITMFLAGHETTALALTWTWYLLSIYPEVEARVHAELDEVLDGRLPTAEDLPQLSYLKMVLQESMRLLPPVWSGGRDVVRDTEVCGYPVRRGDTLVLLPFFTHRHPEFWDHPEAFVPERFAPERLKGRHKFAYFPFSAGPRMCVGNHFTMIEAQLAMAVIGQRFRFDVRPGFPVERDHQITMRPRHGMPVLAYARGAATRTLARAS